MTGGEGEEGEKVIMKNCQAGELNPGLQRERRGGLMKTRRNISKYIICSSIFSILSPERPLAIRH